MLFYAAVMLGINETLQGRYKIIQRLGQGGMGAIYLAEDHKLFGKSVAIKEILFDLSRVADEKELKILRLAFEREAKLLTQLDHDAFPKVIDYFLETDRQFLVMELISGEDLSEKLSKTRQPFAVKSVLDWADQLLEALDYLHTLSTPIIHRDIKPQNIKLTSAGKIKLLDFGIAKGEDAQSNLTITNQTFIGVTMHYSPIEQFLRMTDESYRELLIDKYAEKAVRALDQNPDARSDIFALGATLYHLLTGYTPVDAKKRAFEIWSERTDPLVPPQTFNQLIPQEISVWLLKAMEVDMENRFQSASEMHDALRQISEETEKRKENEQIRGWLKEKEELERRHAEQLIQLEEKRLRQEEINRQIFRDFAAADRRTEKYDEEFAETQPSFDSSAEAKTLANQSVEKDELKNEISETTLSNKSGDLTGSYYFDVNLLKSGSEEKRSEIKYAEIPAGEADQPKTEKSAHSLNQKNLSSIKTPKAKTWIIFTGVILFAAAAVSGIFIFSNLGSGNTNNGSGNISALPGAAQAAPTSSPLSLPTPEASPSTPAKSATPAESPTPVPTTPMKQPAAGATPEPKPSRKPTVLPTIKPRKTPVRATPIQDKSDNCIYNGICRN